MSLLTKLLDVAADNFHIIISAIKGAELDTPEVRSGADKRRIAINIVNDLIDIPLIPESIEAKLIGLLIDLVIYAFNELFGHNWSDKVGTGV